jgi:hypothetical protein
MWVVMDLASASLPVANPEGPRRAASLAASRRDPRISRRRRRRKEQKKMGDLIRLKRIVMKWGTAKKQE